MKYKALLPLYICGFFAISAQSSFAQTSVPVSGEVLASTPCQLAPPTQPVLCPQVVTPIESIIRVKRTGSRLPILLTIRSNADGNFSGQLPPGDYSLKLLRAKIGRSSGQLDVRNLRVSPGKLFVRAGATPQLLLVSHKDRTQPSIEIGYAK